MATMRRRFNPTKYQTHQGNPKIKGVEEPQAQKSIPRKKRLLNTPKERNDFLVVFLFLKTFHEVKSSFRESLDWRKEVRKKTRVVTPRTGITGKKPKLGSQSSM
jgi:hypothetical protein